MARQTPRPSRPAQPCSHHPPPASPSHHILSALQLVSLRETDLSTSRPPAQPPPRPSCCGLSPAPAPSRGLRVGQARSRHSQQRPKSCDCPQPHGACCLPFLTPRTVLLSHAGHANRAGLHCSPNSPQTPTLCSHLKGPPRQPARGQAHTGAPGRPEAWSPLGTRVSHPGQRLGPVPTDGDQGWGASAGRQFSLGPAGWLRVRTPDTRIREEERPLRPKARNPGPHLRLFHGAGRETSD